MTDTKLTALIDAAWEARDTITPGTTGDVRDAVEQVLLQLDIGRLRVAVKTGTNWDINEWVKKAILLSFRLKASGVIAGGYDKVPLKFDNWSDQDFATANLRVVPGAIVRQGAYIASGAVVMPSFINIGAYIGKNTMIDSYVTVGSCAQIGADCHISSGVVIGGVLEPLQANPVIIEDNCFIGANCAITEGVIVRSGAVIAMGVQIGASTKIVSRDGTISKGRIPSGAVVVPGTIEISTKGLSTACAVIIKRVDATTRAKTSVNDLLRD